MQKNAILIFSLIVILALTGCGKKGDPMPIVLPLPGGINDLTGQVKDGVLFLSFAIPRKNRDGSEIKDLAGFKIFRKCGACTGDFEPFRNIVLEEQQGYTVVGGRLYVYDDDVVPGFDYAYKVYPFTKMGTRGDPSNQFALKWQKPPEPPKSVTASASDGAIALKWIVVQGDRYNVYRYDGNRYPFTPVNREPLSTGSFTETGLANGTRYKYDVRTVRTKDGVPAEGQGARIEATPRDTAAPGAPTMVKALKKGSAVSIAWKESIETDFAGYNIYRITGKTTEKLNAGLVKENTFLDGKPPHIRFASYYVTAVDKSGNESEPSQESIVLLKE